MKILKDILKSPSTNRYSRKSVMMIIAFLVAMLIGIYIVVSDYFVDREINRYAFDVFTTLLIFSGGISAMSVAEKKIPTKDKPKEEEI